MPETQTKVESYKVDYLCDECNEGYMRFNGIALTSNPLQYPHTCEKCKACKTFRIVYPSIGYRTTEE